MHPQRFFRRHERLRGQITNAAFLTISPSHVRITYSQLVRVVWRTMRDSGQNQQPAHRHRPTAAISTVLAAFFALVLVSVTSACTKDDRTGMSAQIDATTGGAISNDDGVQLDESPTPPVRLAYPEKQEHWLVFENVESPDLGVAIVIHEPRPVNTDELPDNFRVQWQQRDGACNWGEDDGMVPISISLSLADRTGIQAGEPHAGSLAWGIEAPNAPAGVNFEARFASGWACIDLPTLASYRTTAPTIKNPFSVTLIGYLRLPGFYRAGANTEWTDDLVLRIDRGEFDGVVRPLTKVDSRAYSGTLPLRLPAVVG